MPFNSDTYHANMHRKRAWATLAEARALKARVERGEAAAWEAPHVAFLASSARNALRLSRTFRDLADLEKVGHSPKKA